jgi:hypothetical protein
LSGEEEEEESDGGRALAERWNPSPPSPKAAEAVEEQAPAAGVEVPAAGRSMVKAARAAEAPVSAAGALVSVVVVPPEPSRKRKWGGFSSLR